MVRWLKDNAVFALFGGGIACVVVAGFLCAIAFHNWFCLHNYLLH